VNDAAGEKMGRWAGGIAPPARPRQSIPRKRSRRSSVSAPPPTSTSIEYLREPDNLVVRHHNVEELLLEQRPSRLAGLGGDQPDP
jgi:hypothetical protein